MVRLLFSKFRTRIKLLLFEEVRNMGVKYFLSVDKRNQDKIRRVKNHVITLFTSIHLLKTWSVEIAILPGKLCQIFPWNLKSKSSKLTLKESIFITVRGF